EWIRYVRHDEPEGVRVLDPQTPGGAVGDVTELVDRLLDAFGGGGTDPWVAGEVVGNGTRCDSGPACDVLNRGHGCANPPFSRRQAAPQETPFPDMLIRVKGLRSCIWKSEGERQWEGNGRARRAGPALVSVPVRANSP